MLLPGLRLAAANAQGGSEQETLHVHPPVRKGPADPVARTAAVGMHEAGMPACTPEPAVRARLARRTADCLGSQMSAASYGASGAVKSPATPAACCS